MRGAGRDEDVGSDHPVRPEHSDSEVGNVHRPALAAAHPALASEELAHHRAGVRALGEGMAVAAVVGEEEIGAPEVAADPRRHRLLADGGVDRAGRESLAGGAKGGALERPDTLHRPVVGEEPLRVEVAARRHRAPPPLRFVMRSKPPKKAGAL